MTSTTERVWAELHGAVQAFVRRRIHNSADADDVVQRVFLQVHRGLGSLRDGQRLHAWIYGTARNAIADHYRRSARRREVPSGSGDEFANLADPAGSPEAAEPGLRELAACLQPLIDALPAIDREAIQLTELEGLTQTEAAARLGLSVPGMKSRVQRARQRLKAVVDDCCRVHLDRRGAIVSYEKRAADECRTCDGPERC